MPRPTPPPVAPKPMKPAQTSRCCYTYQPANDRDNECSDKDVIPGMDPLPRMGIGALLAGEWPKLRPAGARGKSGNRLSLPAGSVSQHPVPKLNDSPANSISSFVKHQGGGVLLEQYQEGGDVNLKQTTANGRSSPRPVLKLGESPSMRLVEENIFRGHRLSLPPGYPLTDAGCQGDKNWNSQNVDRKETVTIDKSAPMRSRVSTSPGTKNADTPTSLRYYAISPDRAALLRQIREGISGHLKSSGARKVNGPKKSIPSVLSYPPPSPPSKRGFTAPPPPSTRRFPAPPPPIKGDFPPPPPPITSGFPPPPPPSTRSFSAPPPPSRGGFPPPAPPSRAGFSPPPPSESPQKRPTASSLFVGLDRAALLSQIERSLASPAKPNNLGKVRVPAEPLTNSSLGTSLPSTWDPMPRDENGNDVTIYSTKVPPESSENQEVEKLFQRTANASSMTIISVERIQNPYLYQVYQMRKQKMDNDNGGNNERRLFHGTHPGTLSKINTQGFNRSFSGLAHGTRLGKGVYFARDSSFSKSYASGGDGGRYMYLARVLVGQYCKGDSAMVVPPPKNPSRPEILFDSVVDQKENPSIFVVFFDNQCYPEYLIRFQVPEDI